MIDTQAIAVAVETQSTSTNFNIAQAIEEHLPLVQTVARMAYHRYGRNFEHDDLAGYGHLGLVSAARKYAAQSYDLRQAVDFTNFARKRIWRSIEIGRDRMATIHRTHYRLIKRGQMARPRFIREGEGYSLAQALAGATGDGAECAADCARADEMAAWLRQQNPLWSKVVDLHLHQGMTFERIGAVIGRSRGAASNLYRRAITILRWKYNPAAYRHDDRSARRRRPALRSA